MSTSSYETLDLDINNYTISDLERFFRLNYATATYTADDVQYKECVIREQLLKSGHVNKKFKADLIGFLEGAKRWIIAAKCPPPATPTSIPHDFRLDATPDIPAPHASTITAGRNEELIFPATIKPLHTTSGNKFYSGSLNPLESRLKMTNICIDTLFRKNYTTTKSTDFTYVFPKVINNAVSLKLASLELPIVWNTFSAADRNNTMSISLYSIISPDGFTPLPDLIDFQIVIPDGNYTQNKFVQTLNNIFNYNSDIGLNFLWCCIDDVTLSTVIRARNSVTENFIKGAFPFDPTSDQYSPNFNFHIDFTVKPEGATRPAYKNLGWLIGFRETAYSVNSSNTFTSYNSAPLYAVKYDGYLKSESFFGSTINNYLFIEVDDFQNNFPTDSIISSNDPYGNYLGKNIIAKVTIRSSVNTILNDNGSDLVFKKRDYFGPVNLEKLKIRVLNRFGDVVNINANDFSLTFEVTTLNTNC